MPYTLMKFLAWGVAFFAIGMLTGWLLRSLRARTDAAAARAARASDTTRRPSDQVDGAEQPDDEAAQGPDVASDIAALDSVGHDDEHEPSAATEADAEVDAASQPHDVPASDDERPPPEPPPEPAAAAEPEPESEPPAERELDLEAASAVLGCTVKLDDLTLVDGIGPKIAELCTGIGVITWQALAHTDVVALQSMLDAAGSRYKMHDPSSWPRQAAFLAAGDWEGFRRFHDERTARS